MIYWNKTTPPHDVVVVGVKKKAISTMIYNATGWHYCINGVDSGITDPPEYWALLQGP